ncbi:unnamed protein product [Peniophora sp. CBMAI 1063]|nr:unnamed protein product [Peniophora sp. CBMAI 1063]
MNASLQPTQGREHQESVNTPDGSLCVTAIRERAAVHRAASYNGRDLGAHSRVAAMDSELAAIDSALADFRRDRNSLILAAACPPEILSSIFLFLADLEPNYYSDPDEYLELVTRKPRPRQGWMKVIKVCHSWRAAAFADGRLWTTATTTMGLWWTREMVRLSKNFSLSLDLRCTASPGKEYYPFTLITKNAHRLSRLQVLCSARGGERLGSLCKEPAPMLEALYIFVRERKHQLPDDVFAKHMPRLRELYLHNAVLSWDLLPGLRLTHLTLTSNDC